MWWHDVSWVLSVDCFSVVVEFLLHFHFFEEGHLLFLSGVCYSDF